MRSSTSVRYAIGSTPFSFAVWISVMAIAQCRAPPSLPANKAFLRVIVIGLSQSSLLCALHRLDPPCVGALDGLSAHPDGTKDGHLLYRQHTAAGVSPASNQPL